MTRAGFFRSALATAFGVAAAPLVPEGHATFSVPPLTEVDKQVLRSEMGFPTLRPSTEPFS